MANEKIGILHPGEMGAVVAATVRNSGHEAWWVSAGRSAETRRRAEEAGLMDAGSLDQLCATCGVIVSVCPPEFAEEMARAVAGRQFRGLFLDVNAIAPEKARRIARVVSSGGGTFLDGCIIGLPARTRGQTWLYVSGENAGAAALYFSGGPLEFETLGDDVGQASALKMCFAAYSKGTTALLAAVLGTAEGLGVERALERQWGRSGPNYEKAVASVRGAAPKAWRFAGEMKEIAATFESAGVPGGFPKAAGEVYEKLRGFKGAGPPGLGAILEKVRG